MRVQSIIRELRGEKIDIIRVLGRDHHLAEKALQPAKVSRVSITDLAENRSKSSWMTRNSRSPSAKKGQNVRLAAKLPAVEDRHQVRGREAPGSRAADAGHGRRSHHPIEQVTELGESVMEKSRAGITTVEALAT